MRLRLIVTVSILAAASCASYGTAGETRAAAQLPTDYFSLNEKCMKAWDDVFVEWLRYGGGVKQSMTETRRQIALDAKSRFAAMVRATWAAQRPQSSNRSKVGSWPVAEVEYQRVIGNVHFSDADGIPAECETVVWLDSILWDDLRSDGAIDSARRPAEVPHDLKWESPDAQQWVSYWLFVRLD